MSLSNNLDVQEELEESQEVNEAAHDNDKGKPAKEDSELQKSEKGAH